MPNTRVPVIQQRLNGDDESICIKCFHRNVCRAIDNQPCIECNQFTDANGVTVQKWIPVSERLPDLELAEVKTDDKDVFPCLAARKHPRAKNGKYTAKVWYDGYGFVDGISNDVTDEITHWMPLPEPPKGD